jgi:hypothetical protein
VTSRTQVAKRRARSTSPRRIGRNSEQREGGPAWSELKWSIEHHDISIGAVVDGALALFSHDHAHPKGRQQPRAFERFVPDVLHGVVGSNDVGPLSKGGTISVADERDP